MKTLPVILALFITVHLWSQDSSNNDTLVEKIGKLDSDLNILKKIKITGYIQAQYQKAEEKGIESFSGDNFDKGIDQRFSIRRGRLKTAYTGKGSEIAFQLDLNEKGVGLKEAYIKFSDPWFKVASIQGGIYNRHFGFEIPFSSSVMEAPERSRVIQTIFPGETDLGFSLILQGPKNHFTKKLKLETGFFSGSNNKVDFDNYKDFIGRVSFKDTYLGESLSVGIGASYYNGGMANQSTEYYQWENNTFAVFNTDTLSSMKREYYGVDAQLSFETPVGLTTIRGEIVAGQQAGLTKNTKTPLTVPSGATYLRDFQGGYVYFVQGIAKSKHNLVLKYDWYDPNTHVASKDVVASSGATKADIAYSTLGFGWYYNWDSNIRFTAYYDIVRNEKTLIRDYTEDNNDNVLTLRILYKF